MWVPGLLMMHAERVLVVPKNTEDEGCEVTGMGTLIEAMGKKQDQSVTTG